MSQQPTTTANGYLTDLKFMPKAFWWGLGMGVAAFVISFNFGKTMKVNGVVTECSYTDVFALFAAAVCLVCAVVGLKHGFKAHPERSVHPAMLGSAALVVLVLAGIHVLRGLGMIGGPC